MRLFIDDIRQPYNLYSGDFMVARNVNDAISLVNRYGLPIFISFDHDLGESGDVRDFVKWLCDYMIEKDVKFPKGFTYQVHSQNPVGKEWIKGTMDNMINHIGYM